MRSCELQTEGYHERGAIQPADALAVFTGAAWADWFDMNLPMHVNTSEMD
jgi:hypothetical protein